MKELYSKLQAYWNFERGDKIVFILIKSVLLIFAGAYLKELISGDTIEPKEVVIFASTFIGWFILEARMIWKEKSFPVTILNHLTATKELEDVNKQYKRKENIDAYISNSISLLNDNTCPIQFSYGQSNQLCHQDIKNSLYNVLLDLIERTQNFLNTDYTQFSVGIFIKNIYDPSAPKGEFNRKPTSIVFRDDLGVEEHFPSDIEELAHGNVTTFYLQTKIQETIKIGHFVSEHKKVNNQTYLFVFAPIPNVCANCPPDGTIILISKQKESAPEDLENILKIFGQIVSNWVSKFNDCIYKDKDIERIAKEKLAAINSKEPIVVTNQVKPQNGTKK